MKSNGILVFLIVVIILFILIFAIVSIVLECNFLFLVAFRRFDDALIVEAIKDALWEVGVAPHVFARDESFGFGRDTPKTHIEYDREVGIGRFDLRTNVCPIIDRFDTEFTDIRPLLKFCIPSTRICVKNSMLHGRQNIAIENLYAYWCDIRKIQKIFINDASQKQKNVLS